MLKTTPLLHQHQLAGAKLVDFSGWQMPLHYGSQIQEHHYVREDAGMFDVSHMAIVDVSGEDALPYLKYLLANDAGKLDRIGKALYTCMLNKKGGVIDDLIVYKFSDKIYRLVLNAGTRQKDWEWLLAQQKRFKINLMQRDDLAMIALQGPNSLAKILPLFEPDEQEILTQLRPFHGVQINDSFYSKTGYTGEDGFEIQVPAQKVSELWQSLLSVGIEPCGLGARDTLRLEAGLNLYGLDMDETTTPLESNLEWTVAFEPADRDFIGRKALEKQKKSAHRKMVGLVLESSGVLRSHQKVIFPNNAQGEITSGSFSPTLGHAIALARIPENIQFDTCEVEIRQKKVPVKMVKPPFVRKGKKVFKET